MRNVFKQITYMVLGFVIMALICPTASADEAGLAQGAGLEHLVPELAENPYQISPGPRRFLRRLTFSPGVGWLGSQRLYVVRLAYNPNSWLGYESSLGHNPGQSVQALFHMLNVVVRYPFSGRIQPYATFGYGMMHVFPGKALNADPGTENTLGIGAGLEFYVRDDLSIRSELRGISVIGGDPQQDGVVAYNYREVTFGFAFHRPLGAGSGDD